MLRLYDEGHIVFFGHSTIFLIIRIINIENI